MLFPAYLEQRDYPWLASLLEVVNAYAGKPRRDLAIRLLEELPVVSPPGKRKLASYVLQRMLKDTNGDAPIPAKRIRAILFRGPACTHGRVAALENAAIALNLTAEKIEPLLFADLPRERLVSPLPADLQPQRLLQEVNLRLAQALLFRASEVVIELRGNSRSIIRYAKWRGLICNVTADPEREAARIVISGPFSLFRRTLLYGKALSELLPLLASCDDFELMATCLLKGQPKPLQLRISAAERVAFCAQPVSRFDSKVEMAFAKDFLKLGSDWNLIREPEPVPAGPALFFPDFCLQHRRDPRRKWFLEIVGFWTPEYLTKKIGQLERAGMPNLLLCVDEKLDCSEKAFPIHARAIFYRKKIDPRSVLRLLGES